MFTFWLRVFFVSALLPLASGGSIPRRLFAVAKSLTTASRSILAQRSRPLVLQSRGIVLRLGRDAHFHQRTEIPPCR